MCLLTVLLNMPILSLSIPKKKKWYLNIICLWVFYFYIYFKYVLVYLLLLSFLLIVFVVLVLLPNLTLFLLLFKYHLLFIKWILWLFWHFANYNFSTYLLLFNGRVVHIYLHIICIFFIFVIDFCGLVL